MINDESIAPLREEDIERSIEILCNIFRECTNMNVKQTNNNDQE